MDTNQKTGCPAPVSWGTKNGGETEIHVYTSFIHTPGVSISITTDTNTMISLHSAEQAREIAKLLNALADWVDETQ